MNKTAYFYLLFLAFCLPGYAQKNVTVSLEEQPLSILFRQIEEQSSYRIFSQPEETDTCSVTVDVTNAEPVSLLENTLKGFGFTVHTYNNYIFIIKEKPFVTSLPEGFGEKATEIKKEDEEISLLLSAFNNREQKATSENKIYEIGSPVTDLPEKVILTGTITNFKNGEPVTGASIYIKELQTGAVTDPYGYYKIELPGGRHELQIQGIGLEETKRQVVLYANGKLDIELQEQVYALREVVISSEKSQNVRRTTLGMERLEISAIKNIPTAFGEMDIMRIVMSLPGVKSVGEASTGFNVRGGSTDQNLILFNEGTLYNPTHLFGFFSAINPDVVKDMELYKSSIPAQYGGRISSVLDINSREGNKKQFKGAVSLGVLTSRLTVEGPVFKDKTSFILGARTTYSDWILKQLPEKSGYKNGTAGFHDLNATIAHKFNDKSNLYVNGYFSHDRFSFSKEDHYSYQNANASAKWRQVITPTLTSTLTAGYDHYDYSTWDVSQETHGYNLSFGIDQVYGKSLFTWYPSNDHTVDFGLSSTYYMFSPGKQTPRGENSLLVTDQLQKEKAVESAIFLSEKWDITPDLSVQAGIRYSLFNVLGPREYFLYEKQELPSLANITDTVYRNGGSYKTYHGAEYRISARYEFPNNMSVKIGYNTMRQYLHKLSNTTTISPTDTWKLSDQNIRPQNGSQVAAGIYKNLLNNTLEASIEVYYKTMNNYLDYRSGAELIMNHHIETDVVETKGKAYGAEIMLKKDYGKLNGWVSYTYSRTKLRQKDKRISEPVNNGNWYPADYDKPHEFKLVGNYKFTHRFSFSLNCDYSTGRPITLPVSKYQYANGEYVYYTDRNQNRISDFFRIDTSFNIEPSHHLTLLTHSSISFGIYNLTGRKNTYSVYFQNENGRLKGYKMAIFGVPIPYISYNIKF